MSLYASAIWLILSKVGTERKDGLTRFISATRSSVIRAIGSGCGLPGSWMGRPRGGKAKESMEAAKNEDAGSAGEEVIPAYKRRGRPQKLLKHDADEEEDTAKVEDDGDGTKEKIAPRKESTGAAGNGGKKRRRQSKRGSESATEEKGGAPARAPTGFRQNGSRRKSTPRRAAEAGVESK
ncbi:unnamed protein product [Triticum turgidum subsp. durum]|uniref:Uncharacterized protein n=3 Tax=Triticum TaxID=4564 RepID=A0A9R0XBV1_TRITD|nr:unnamed protein product [Triticum turgidum subsp. durum]